MRKLARACALAALALAALLLAACGGDDGGSSTTASGRRLDEVTVQLDYQIRGNHAPFFVAKEKGYFADEGIDVKEIRIGTGSPDAMRIVGGGQADFGFGDLPTLVTARTQGADVVALAAVNQRTPLGFCAKRERHDLRSPKDLVGLTFGAHTAGSTYIFYRAMIAANGIDRSQITEATVTPPFESFLLQDRVDFVVCYIDAEVPELEARAGGPGSLAILHGSDWGYDAYGSGLFTSGKLIESDPDLVQRFVNAYAKAFRYVIDHPKEAAELLERTSPELKGKAHVFEAQLDADIRNTFTSPTTEAKGLGAMDPRVWRSTIDVLASQRVIERVPTVEEVYDETFIDKANGRAGS